MFIQSICKFLFMILALSKNFTLEKKQNQRKYCILNIKKDVAGETVA